jgi:serine/threonine protein kinase
MDDEHRGRGNPREPRGHSERQPRSRVGNVLNGQYRLNGLLGQGAMGVVYRATQLSVNRPVAIKLLAGHVTHGDAMERFRREASVMAQLRHPHSVRLFDFGVTDHSELFIVMELLEGCDLAQHLARYGRISEREALLFTRQILESLCEAHSLGLVHRDLKPANVFLCKLPGGQVVAKVMDFGVVGLAHGGLHQEPLTAPGLIIGSPAYLAPEQARGEKVDGRSDLYSLGVTLFEMLTAKRLFRAKTTALLLEAQVSMPALPLRAVCPHVEFSRGLQELLNCLLRKRPNQRPASAEYALQLVDDILRDQVFADSGVSSRDVLSRGRELLRLQAVVWQRLDALCCERFPEWLCARLELALAVRFPRWLADQIDSGTRSVTSWRRRLVWVFLALVIGGLSFHAT